MTAQGGDPEAMSVSQYLDLAYAVVVDERVRRGASLFDALDDTRDMAAGGDGIKVATASGTRTKPVVTEAQNDAALMQLQGMMSGLGGGGFR